LWYFNSVPVGLVRSRLVEGELFPTPPDRLTGQVKIPSGWVRQVVSRKPSVRAFQKAAEQEFWDEVVESAWGTTYEPKCVEKEYWDAVDRASFERSYHEWCERKKWPKKPLFKFAKKLLTCRDTSCLLHGGSKDWKCAGVRSRLPSRQLYATLSRPEGGRKDHVWVKRVDEEEQVLPEPRAYMQTMVQKKIALVSSWETPQLDSTIHMRVFEGRDGSLPVYVRW
jgi:hypothetical protein